VRILWVGTKPPWPPEDGGRLVAANTIEALARAGHEVTVVAPALGQTAPNLPDSVTLHTVAATPRSLPVAVVEAVATGVPVSIARHSRPDLRARVARLLVEQSFDVVHAEQAQALPQCDPALAAGLRVVFRAHNVESELWAAAGKGRLGGWLARLVGARFARWEGEAVRRVAATVALTALDAARLEAFAVGSRRVQVVPAPVAGELPPAERPLPGEPALVLMGSPRWLPNRQGAEWFVAEAWPRILSVLRTARLHVFGFAPRSLAAEGLELHPAPRESREAFPAGAVLVVPLSVASGVRMKILEAWARGVPVVATPTAAAGLEATDGRELLLAPDAPGFVAALRRLHDEPALRPALTAAGRDLLHRRHDPAAVAAALAAIYSEAG
jgi:glycosyltransferase involved in cell wall biosynthesis